MQEIKESEKNAFFVTILKKLGETKLRLQTARPRKQSVGAQIFIIARSDYFCKRNYI
jgi:hypothetical protein